MATWQREYLLEHAVETGLGDGNGLRHLLALGGWKSVTSVELDARRAAAVLKHVGEVCTILVGDSTQHVGELASSLGGPALWWLDAHYDGGGLPLAAEVRAIMQARDVRGDAFILDDCRIYGQPCASGPLPAGYERGDVQAFLDVEAALRRVLRVSYDRRDEGYLVALPGGRRTA